MTAINGDVCPLACIAACDVANRARASEDSFSIAVLVVIAVLLLIDAVVAAAAIFSVGQQTPVHAHAKHRTALTP